MTVARSRHGFEEGILDMLASTDGSFPRSLACSDPNVRLGFRRSSEIQRSRDIGCRCSVLPFRCLVAAEYGMKPSVDISMTLS